MYKKLLINDHNKFLVTSTAPFSSEARGPEIVFKDYLGTEIKKINNPSNIKAFDVKGSVIKNVIKTDVILNEDTLLSVFLLRTFRQAVEVEKIFYHPVGAEHGQIIWDVEIVLTKSFLKGLEVLDLPQKPLKIDRDTYLGWYTILNLTTTQKILLSQELERKMEQFNKKANKESNSTSYWYDRGKVDALIRIYDLINGEYDSTDWI